MELEEEAVFEE